MLKWSSKCAHLTDPPLFYRCCREFKHDSEAFVLVSPAGAVCYPGDRFADCLHDVGHHGAG